MTDYDKYPAHPLFSVPAEVLQAARRTTNEAATWKDVDPDTAEAIADAVLIAALPVIRAWLADGLAARAGALLADNFRAGRIGIDYIAGLEHAADYIRNRSTTMEYTPFPKLEILLAVIGGDEECAIEILKTMTPRERLMLRHHGHQMTALITAIRRELGEE